jgi:FdrA protein
MSITKVEIRHGTYYDSVVLMQLQRSLTKLSGVEDAGVMMGTPANKALLKESNLLLSEAKKASNDDLVIVVRADSQATAEGALAEVDTLLTRRGSVGTFDSYLPQSLESATNMMPDAQWVLVSVPGRYAAGVAREALRLGKNVFLYSDNVSLEDEIALKQSAAEKGLLVMGPDCGTAIVNGVGLGFANGVRRGPIGLIAASGTGLQAVTAAIHNRGGGITHAFGTGGRDLSSDVNGITARQALTLLSHDPETKVIVLISKPPAPEVANALLNLARSTGKPVVVDFIGYAPPAKQIGNLHFSATFDETAALAITLSEEKGTSSVPLAFTSSAHSNRGRYLRGLFSGGTLAYEAMLILSGYLSTDVTARGASARVCPYSNVPLDKDYRLENPHQSREHTIVDLGEDEFTIGRLHPMMDNSLRIGRLQQEADDPEVAVLLLDVVLGYGAHPDPASELAPAIAQAKERALKAGRDITVVAVVIGTDQDPQDLEKQVEQLRAAGAHVETSNKAAAHYIGNLLQAINKPHHFPSDEKEVDLSVLQAPLTAINVGLESFTESLTAQGATVLQVKWQPPAGGNERLMAILARMKGR